MYADASWGSWGQPSQVPAQQNQVSNTVEDFLAPWTQQAPNTEAGSIASTLVEAIPNLQSTVSQLINPTNLRALTRRQARLQQRLQTETSPVKRAQLEAELQLVTQQLAQLQAALSTTQVPAVAPSTPTISWAWIPFALLGVAVIGGGLYLLGRRRR